MGGGFTVFNDTPHREELRRMRNDRDQLDKYKDNRQQSREANVRG
jgi:hypothetical protein